MLSLTICIPAFNEEVGLPATLDGLARERRLDGAAVMVVDDGSSDRTAEVAQGYPRVVVIRHGRNLGYGAAIKSAVQRCQSDLVAWYDADGQHRPEDLVAMVDRLERESLDVVFGARGPGSHFQVERALGKGVLKTVAQGIAGMAIPDLNCGLRVFRRVVLLPYLHLLPDGFSASTTTTLLMLKRRYRAVFHPVIAEARKGKSSVRQVRDGLATLHLIARILVLFDAMRLFTALAAVFMVSGISYGLVVALHEGKGLPVLSAVLIIAAVVIFLMGLISDQISAMRIEQLEAAIRLRTEKAAPDPRA